VTDVGITGAGDTLSSGEAVVVVADCCGVVPNAALTVTVSVD
jgi:hypothetical protein